MKQIRSTEKYCHFKNFCLSTRDDHTFNTNCTQDKEEARSKSTNLQIFSVEIIESEMVFEIFFPSIAFPTVNNIPEGQQCIIFPVRCCLCFVRL